METRALKHAHIEFRVEWRIFHDERAYGLLGLAAGCLFKFHIFQFWFSGRAELESMGD